MHLSKNYNIKKEILTLTTSKPVNNEVMRRGVYLFRLVCSVATPGDQRQWENEEKERKRKGEREDLRKLIKSLNWQRNNVLSPSILGN